MRQMGSPFPRIELPAGILVILGAASNRLDYEEEVVLFNGRDLHAGMYGPATGG